MYTLVTLADVVQIHPTNFRKASHRAIEDAINEKYADKVIHKVGLCVGFHSLITASEGLIGHGTGIVSVNVDFKLIVFRPFKGEIIRATINYSDQNGIALATEFYDDFEVPPETLFENTKYQKDDQDETKECWVWHAGDDAAQYYFDTAESCLVRVEEELWHDISPEEAQAQKEAAAKDNVDEDACIPPYRVRGSMMQTGLGPTLWWGGEIEGEGDDAVATSEGAATEAANGT